MTFLTLTIWTSTLLTTLALGVMLIVAAHRAFLTWKNRRDETRKAFLTGQALEYLEDPHQLTALQAHLRRGDQRLFGELFESLMANVEGEYADRLLDLMRHVGLVDRHLATLQSRFWWRRLAACISLSWFNEPRVIAALEAALDDPQIDVRVEAGRALVKLGAAGSAMILLTKLGTETRSLSLAVADLFRNLGPRIVPSLIAILEQNTSDAAKTLAADALGHSGDLQAVAPLVRLADHPSPRVRLAVMRALGELSDPRALVVVVEAFHDPRWEVRAQAAVSAGQQGATEVIPHLERLLEDEEWWVRYQAACALVQLAEPGAAALRNTAATAKNPRATQIARAILREKGLELAA